MASVTLGAIIPAHSGADSHQRPNFVIVICDDLDYAPLGFMGNNTIQTPHIDGLAEEGVVFENAFVTTSICQTSRASFMTGRYAARTGIYMDGFNGLDNEQARRTYPADLNRAGYHTGYVGKWHLGPAAETLFDANQAFRGQGRFWSNERPPESGKHLTPRLGQQAVDMIQNAPSDKPFAITVGFKAPHVQDGFHPVESYPPPPSTATLYETAKIPAPPLSSEDFFKQQPEFIRTSLGRDRWEYRLGPPRSLNFQRSVRRYYRMITGIDQQVGRIRKALREAGRAESTIILFTSDHGMYLGERGLAGKWLGHETSIRIPFVVFDPRLPEAQRGTRRQEMALLLDIKPTLLDWAHTSADPGAQGRSLAPLVKGESPDSWRKAFFYEHHSFPNRIPKSEGVRTERYKYLRYLDSEPLYEELYDLKEDPHEADNLAEDPQHKALLQEMRNQWETWRERVQ